MDAREFATRMVTDDDFMLEIIREMPDPIYEELGVKEGDGMYLVPVSSSR